MKETISLSINGREITVEDGTSILEAAKQGNIYIPSLCYIKGLSPLPSVLPDMACRLCLVETDGEIKLSCSTPATAGMNLTTESPRIQELRRRSLTDILRRFPSVELMEWGHNGSELQRAVKHIGLNELSPAIDRKLPIREDSPFFIRDNNLCILCQRCVRACHEIQFNHAIEYSYPCMKACPAGIDIPRYIKAIGHGQPGTALAVIREKVPFPGVLGRVCIHPCEQACQRGKEVDDPLQIRFLKRFAADHGGEAWKAKAKHLPPTGKKVAVAGAGPAGLTAACYLAKLGHEVTVFESQPRAGGMMLLGIPEYRLPRDVLEAEIQDITDAGVEIRLNSPVTELETLFSRGYNAVFLGLGAHKGMKLGVEGDDLPGVTEAVEFLRRGNLGERIAVGERVGVVGGGNVAIDAARMSRRFGAQKVTMFYRRTRAEMPAADEEIEAAIAEGIEIEYLTAPVKVERNGETVELTCNRMQLGELDASGRPHPIPVEGSEFVTPLDTLLVAIGQRPDVAAGLAVETGRGNVIKIDNAMMTTREGVFSGGDCASGPASVIEAIQAGRKAAEAIDRYLGGKGDISESLVSADQAMVFPPETPVEERPARLDHLPPEERIKSFDEVELPWNWETAIAEAQRCMRCHVIAPPDGSELREADCRFCGACLNVCPTGAIAERSVLAEGLPERTVTTTCPYCAVGCQMDLGIKNGRIVTVHGNPQGPANHGKLCVKGRFGIGEFVHSKDRLKKPLIRRDGKLIEVSWDEALNYTAERLKTYKAAETGIISSARSTNEANYVMQKFGRAVIGTHNIDHCARL